MTQPSTPSPERAAQGGNTTPFEDCTYGAEETQAQQTADNTGERVTPSSNAAANPAQADSSESACGEDIVEEAAEILDELLDAEVVDAPCEELASDVLVALAQQQAAEWQDKYIRLHAEWDTYRRRTTEQREVEKARAAEKLVSGLLPVIDDFERTIDYATKNGEENLFEGIKAVHAKFVGILMKDGVEVINPAGQAFDSLESQAVATVEDASVPDETIHEVYQKGYKMGTKILRPAMVTVTTGGPKREKPSEDASGK